MFRFAVSVPIYFLFVHNAGAVNVTLQSYGAGRKADETDNQSIVVGEGSWKAGGFGCLATGGFTSCKGKPELYGTDGVCHQQCPYVTYEGLSFATKSSSRQRNYFPLSQTSEGNKMLCIDYCADLCYKDSSCRSYSVHIETIFSVPASLECYCYLHKNWICDYGSNCEGKYLGKQCGNEIAELSCVISAICRPEKGWYDNVDC